MLTAAPPAAPPSPRTAVPAPTPLVVGDGRTVRLISLGGTRTDDLLTRIAGDIGAAVGAVEKFWGTDWDREIVVIATDSQAQFIAQAGLDPNGQWNDIAAVSVADHVDFEHRHASGQRIVFAPGAADMSEGALRIVLTHELFHLAARADTALDAPRWLLEGTADFVARPPEPLPPDAAANTALPADADLDVAGPQRERGYDRAWWFARFVADTYGVDALRRLYVEACGPGRSDFATAVQRALHTDMTALRARWAQWLTR
ncbi:hypothetical protein FHT40_003139 [Mycolicibacterium sp. BK556]|uniref:hypothetical protein n=1 Tax=unclassified Mycolicibacterium TaxID=2636767 RepID=UPI001617BF99|nr:hypothetical protein [Mycolicibacterium sp. BK556]MBB3633673.1 hypothetical protein [Mycolicibacterium sp. BK607]